MHRFVALSLVLLAAAVGIFGQADPWSLANRGNPADQRILAHRDSPYTHVTWAVSHADNSAELRFYDRVEGGVCLRPSWAELADLGLPHLAMPGDYRVDLPPAGARWPADLAKPNPGTLSHTRYICLYPVGLLLNETLVASGGGDWRASAPRIGIVGLGSGVGLAILAHHLPQVHIVVIDIDQVVIDMVRDHYPLIRWLEEQGRVELVQRDARQYIAHAAATPGDDDDFDLIILDAYTAGSTIPPHLMTREFYGECADALRPGGMVLSNIIGSYTGPQHAVLGGAIRSMRAGKLPWVLNFPVHTRHSGDFNESQPRNNMVLAAPEPFYGPGHEAARDRLKAFAASGDLYREIPLGTYLSTKIGLYEMETDRFGWQYPTPTSSEVHPEVFADSPAKTDLLNRLDAAARAKQVGPGEFVTLDDPDLIALAARLVRENLAAYPQPPVGWDATPARIKLGYQGHIDWVLHARKVLQNSVNLALVGGSNPIHAGETLVGPLEGERGPVPTWTIPDTPLFTDAMPNADMYNH